MKRSISCLVHQLVGIGLVFGGTLLLRFGAP